MSVKDFKKCVVLQNLTNGYTQKIEHYYEMPYSLRLNLLEFYIDKFLEDTDNIKVSIMYDM